MIEKIEKKFLRRICVYVSARVCASVQVYKTYADLTGGVDMHAGHVRYRARSAAKQLHHRGGGDQYQ